MKCPECGKIVRKDHGKAVEHPCNTLAGRSRRGRSSTGGISMRAHRPGTTGRGGEHHARSLWEVH